jgi:hypothetical protein
MRAPTPAPRLRLKRAVLALALGLTGCGQVGEGAHSGKAGDAVIGLCSTLPIAWNENEDLRGQLADRDAPSWVLTALRERGRAVPLDTLADKAGALPLPRDGALVLAQPRALTARENVALDAWVQGGGRVLLFADPMLTAPTRFAPGDPRRPQDVALLSPILARWGLVLEFDEAQPAGERPIALREGVLPVNLAGRWSKVGMNGETVGTCVIDASGLLADCRAGKGRIVALADAAVLENVAESAENAHRANMFQALLARLED